MNSEKALREALERMVYETTHLSPCEYDGAHRCVISGEALTLAREALAKPSPAPVEREGVVARAREILAQARVDSADLFGDRCLESTAIRAISAAPAPEPVREGQRVGNDELTDAKQLLDMLVAADDEAKPNGIMDCIDNDGSPYQSAFMAGLITHARMLVRPYDHAAAIAAFAAFRAAAPLSAREGE